MFSKKKNLNLVITIILNSILVILVYINSNDKKHYKKELDKCGVKMNQMDSVINVQNEIIKENYNHVKRIQLIAGVDSIKDVFSYKDKVLNGVDVKRLLHYKRKYTKQ